MNLLLISVKSELSSGGIAAWTDRFLSVAKQQNIRYSLVNTEVLGDRAKTGKRRLKDEFVRTHRIFKELKRCLKEEQFDAAYLNTSCGTFGLFRDERIARIIRRHNIPLVTQYHCEIPWWVKRTASIRCLGRLARMTVKNLVLCQNSQTFLQDTYGINSLKIPNFVESAMVIPTEKTMRPAIERVCFVGNVSQGKGAEELFDVARQLPHITFELVGDVAPIVADWETPHNICLLGGISNERVLERLDAADLFLFPSHTEGCSMALMEAMARGLPCIATDVGANADMLGDECGVLVKKYDTAAMVNALQRLQDVALRQTLSRNAVQKVREHYTEKNVEHILAEIQGLCKEGIR